mmetsp:Transcript_49922/g.142688  ORF Transcript_49922/g.142688 Transcript_49922/m.142688 type:complete len:334 (-) Transcript_49922:178-1179(-)
MPSSSMFRHMAVTLSSPESRSCFLARFLRAARLRLGSSFGPPGLPPGPSQKCRHSRTWGPGSALRALSQVSGEISKRATTLMPPSSLAQGFFGLWRGSMTFTQRTRGNPQPFSQEQDFAGGGKPAIRPPIKSVRPVSDLMTSTEMHSYMWPDDAPGLPAPLRTGRPQPVPFFQWAPWHGRGKSSDCHSWSVRPSQSPSRAPPASGARQGPAVEPADSARSSEPESLRARGTAYADTTYVPAASHFLLFRAICSWTTEPSPLPHDGDVGSKLPLAVRSWLPPAFRPALPMLLVPRTRPSADADQGTRGASSSSLYSSGSTRPSLSEPSSAKLSR